MVLVQYVLVQYEDYTYINIVYKFQKDIPIVIEEKNHFYVLIHPI